jgi:hypothetical protein
MALQLARVREGRQVGGAELPEVGRLQLARVREGRLLATITSIGRIGRDQDDAVSRAMRARAASQGGAVIGQMRRRHLVNLDKLAVMQADQHTRVPRHSSQRFSQPGKSEAAFHVHPYRLWQRPRVAI